MSKMSPIGLYQNEITFSTTAERTHTFTGAIEKYGEKTFRFLFDNFTIFSVSGYTSCRERALRVREKSLRTRGLTNKKEADASRNSLLLYKALCGIIPCVKFYQLHPFLLVKNCTPLLPDAVGLYTLSNPLPNETCLPLQY